MVEVLELDPGVLGYETPVDGTAGDLPTRRFLQSLVSLAWLGELRSPSRAVRGKTAGREGWHAAADHGSSGVLRACPQPPATVTVNGM
jgi:hypothetical protein